MTTPDSDAWDDLQVAAICGLTYRFGPTDAQLAEMSWWRRALCRVLPQRHRWRVTPLAGQIREYNRLVTPPTAAQLEGL